MFIEEIYRKVKGFEDSYIVSNTGKVMRTNKKNNKEMKLAVSNFGYHRVGLCFNGKKYRKSVHRLVAEAFIPNPNNFPQVNHKDEIRLNNNVANLEWCDSKYNNNYGTKNDRARKVLTGKQTSEETKLKISLAYSGNIDNGMNPKAKRVICDGVEYDCIKRCASYYDINDKTMRNWLLGKHRTPDKFIKLGLRYVDEQDLFQKSNKPVMCNGEVFDSVSALSDKLNVNASTVSNWLLGKISFPDRIYELRYIA